MNFGKLKNKSDEKFINKLFQISSNIEFNILDIADENPKWNYDFYKELAKCKMALNLSRGKPIKYATSNSQFSSKWDLYFYRQKQNLMILMMMKWVL